MKGDFKVPINSWAKGSNGFNATISNTTYCYFGTRARNTYGSITKTVY